MLEATDCKIWANAEEVTPIPMVQDVIGRRPMTVLQLPSLEELLDSSIVRTYRYDKTFEAAKNEPMCYLHTSGTTGVPKPIPWSHALIGTMDAVRLLPPMKGEDGEDLVPWTDDWKSGDTIYSSFPMSHVSEMHAQWLERHLCSHQNCITIGTNGVRGRGSSWTSLCLLSLSCDVF